MTVEEIKEQYSMQDIVEQCGITVDRAHKAHCPFHVNDRTASMHIYADNFYCFGCGASGDIFSFLMRLNDWDFRTAFRSLGGDQRLSDAGLLRMEKRRKERAKRQERIQQAEYAYHEALEWETIWKNIAKMGEPFSDGWCNAMNHKEKWSIEVDERLDALFEVRRNNK